MDDVKADRITNCTDLDTLKAMYRKEKLDLESARKRRQSMKATIAFLEGEVQKLDKAERDWRAVDYLYLIEKRALELVL